MRTLRITIGVTVAACALAVFAAPSFAAAKPKAFFGEFTASIFGQEISPAHKAVTKGHGSVSTLRIGPLEITCEPAKGEGLNAKGEVEHERSPNFTTTVKFSGCFTKVKFGKGGTEERIKVSFGKGLKMEFHANGSGALGNPSGEVAILETVPVQIKVAGRKCHLFVPAQTVPVQAEKNPEKEFEAASYGTETEPVEPHEAKKYPSGFKERLDIEWEMKKIRSYVPVEPGKCEYDKGTEGKFEPEGGGLPNRVEFTNGLFEAELEEIEIKGGELGFDPNPPEEV
jgi:hypothetical protein